MHTYVIYMYTYIYIYIYLFIDLVHNDSPLDPPKPNLLKPDRVWGEKQLLCFEKVLVRVCIYIYIYIYICSTYVYKQ